MSRLGPPKAFFEAPGQAKGQPRRALLITYHFPPGQAAGALRWQKFVARAPDGWTFDVLTLDPGGLASLDTTRLTDLPAGTRLFGIPDPPLAIEGVEAKLARWARVFRERRRRPSGPTEPDRIEARGTPARPGSLAQAETKFVASELRSWWRAYQAWLEIRRGASWASKAVALGSEIFQPGQHRVVISSSPPETAHVAARALAERHRLPLVIDFRDPWSLRERLPEHLSSPLWYGTARRLESRIVERAARVIMNTDVAAEAMKTAYPDHAERILTIGNGCDDDPLPDVEASPRFIIAFAGAIYLDRSPAVLFRAVARVVEELELAPEDLTVEFMGYIDPLCGVDELVASTRLSAFVRLIPPGTHAEAARFLAGAAMLLNLPQDSHMAIPSKVYEYMRYSAFLLVLAEAGSATERLLRETGADVVAPSDERAIADAIRARYLAWRSGHRPDPIADAPRFGRVARAEELFGLLDRVVQDSGTGVA